MEKKIFEIGGWQMDDGRTTDHGYTISSPISLRFRWANKEEEEKDWEKDKEKENNKYEKKEEEDGDDEEDGLFLP